MTALTQILRTLVNRPFAQTRREPRIPFKGALEIRATDGSVFRGVARDLSGRGIGAIVFADLQVGDSVTIKYAEPQRSTTGEMVVRYAHIRSRYGSRYGFEFDGAPTLCNSPN